MQSFKPLIYTWSEIFSKIKVRDLGGVNSIVPRPSYISGAATGGVIKEGVIKNFQNLQKNTCPRVSFLTKLEASGM